MVYNLRRFTYKDGEQIRIYNKPVVIDKNKKLNNEKIEEYEKEKEKEETKKTLELLGWIEKGEEIGEIEVIKEKREREESEVKRSMMVSRNRTINKIYEITRANTWEYFITLTFDPKKIDSTDYRLLSRKVSQWVKNIKKRYAPDLKYILVPELHEDGKKYHFHGLLSDCGEMTFSDSGVTKKGMTIYNLDDFKYGFSTATLVQDNGKVASYITKYITKELITVTEGQKRYWSSRNLEKVVVSNYLLHPDEIDTILESIEISDMKTKKFPNAGLLVTYVEVKN